MNKTKNLPFKILVHEVGEELYYYDGKEITKKIYTRQNSQPYIKSYDVPMTEQDYELMKKIPYKKIYKEKRTPLGRPERSREIILPGCGLEN